MRLIAILSFRLARIKTFYLSVGSQFLAAGRFLNKFPRPEEGYPKEKRTNAQKIGGGGGGWALLELTE